jgi:hypothetical protein
MQGFTTPYIDEELYSALMLQPRIVGVIVALGILVQSPLVFLILSSLLLWSAVVPTRNPFGAIYNYVVARPRGFAPLSIAPAPRRFAMSMAGTVADDWNRAPRQCRHDGLDIRIALRCRGNTSGLR